MSEQRPRVWPPRIGMPGWHYVNMFGELVKDFFGTTAYIVGSAAEATLRGEKGEVVGSRTFRDVDIRVMLPERYEAEGYAHIGGAPLGTKWSAICLAFSALGEKITGLPIDFQVQSITEGNAQPGPRWPIGLRLPRFADIQAEPVGCHCGAMHWAGPCPVHGAPEDER